MPLGFGWDSRMNGDIERAIVFKEMFLYNQCHLHLTFRGRLQSINQALTAPCTGVRRLSHITFSTKLSCVERKAKKKTEWDPIILQILKNKPPIAEGHFLKGKFKKRFPIASQIP